MRQIGQVTLHIALFVIGTAVRIEAQVVPSVLEPGRQQMVVPRFEPYEAEYGSAFGQFLNQVRSFSLNQAAKISILNLIDMPTGIIVDHRVLDASTLRMELMVSPYFFWGQEILVAQSSAQTVDWTRVPIGGGAPARHTAPVQYQGYFDDVLFGPTLAALPGLQTGAAFQLPLPVASADGGVAAVPVTLTVVGRETLRTPAGPTCECWIIEQKAAGGFATRFWVATQAPFVFRRHRDIGGPREFVSELIGFRPLTAGAKPGP
jgi:hypothetical protein